MHKRILLAAAILSGCGSAAPGPAAAPADAAAECTATTISRLPAGWVDTGATVVVTTKEGKPSGIEGHAADGAAHPVAMLPGKEKAALADEVCRLGGLAALVPKDAKETKDGAVSLHVIKPSAPSEKVDLGLFCAGPPDPRIVEVNPDPSQLRLLAMLSLQEVLTTPKWRSWIVARGRQVRAAEGPAKDKVYADMVAELRAAGAPEGCWFAKAVLAH